MTDAIRMKAAVLREFGHALRIEDVVLDPPSRDEILVKVGASGVCHSDLRLAEGGLGRARIPIVLGHEGAGVVVSVGLGVSHVSVGDHVAFSIDPACGQCRFCREGKPTLCEVTALNGGRGTLMDGSTRLHSNAGEPLKHFLFVACFAEYCVVPAKSAVPIPPALPLWQAALLGCAVITGSGAVRNVAQVAAGDSVCVIGCGGVGLQVITAAQLAGAGAIIAVDRSREKLERALGHGASHAIDSSAEAPVDRVKELSDGGVDYAIEVVGMAETIRLAWDVLRPGGSAVVVGLAPVGLEVSIPAIEFLSGKSLKGCYYGSGDPATELPELAEMAAAGRFPLANSVSNFTDLTGIDAAFQRMRDGIGARTVVFVDPTIAGAPPAGISAS
jgi:S-(hydroxymethyl)glutathione dehydrogenase / alcohol dehydrogenase